MIITNDDIRLIGPLNGLGIVVVVAIPIKFIIGADDIIMLAVNDLIVEAIDIVVLRRLFRVIILDSCFRCISNPFVFIILHLIAFDGISDTDNLAHIGAFDVIAAAHDHDLSATLRNGILQGFLKSICIFTYNSTRNFRKRILRINVTIRIRHAVACTDDDSCIGICCHVSLADDAVGYAAECLACTCIVIDVDSTYRNSCSSLQPGGAYNAGIGTDNGRSNAGSAGFIARSQAGKGRSRSTIVVFVGAEAADLESFLDRVIFGLGITDGSLHLPYRSGIRISGTVLQSGDLMGADVHIAAADGGTISTQCNRGT